MLRTLHCGHREPRRARLVFVSLLIAGFAAIQSPDPVEAEDSSKPDTITEVQRRIEQLDHPSFHSRQNAKRVLLDIARLDTGREVSDTIHSGLKHSSMEVRLATEELLGEISLTRFDHQVARLLNPHVSPGDIQIAGWSEFRRHAGDDMNARSFFAKMTRRYSDSLGHLDTLRLSTSGWQNPTLDPYQMRRDDLQAWALLLMMDLEDPSSKSPRLSSRIAMSMTNPSMGVDLGSSQDDGVIRRMIGRWIELRQHVCQHRSSLLIAIRYDCRRQSRQLCSTVLGDPTSSAAAVVTAMLSLNAIGSKTDQDPVIQSASWESELSRRLEDDRTAHVWQLIASRRTKIRTQVRDVAMALLLHRNGLDPRDAGFTELQADPTMIYRDHSLGFADDASRQACYSLARQMLLEVASGEN